jgi:hypothetical protein
MVLIRIYLILHIQTQRRCVEIIARNHYLENRNPNDCLIYYIVLKKKKVLQGLWKLVPHHPEKDKMIKFLSNDFELPKGKTIARKNAYSLLGKHRYGKEFHCH